MLIFVNDISLLDNVVYRKSGGKSFVDIIGSVTATAAQIVAVGTTPSLEKVFTHLTYLITYWL